MKKKMSPAKINKGLEKAAASGKLDKNPKFKAVVEKAARKRKDDTPAMLKKSMATLKKSMAKLMKDEKSAMMMKSMAKMGHKSAVKMGHKKK